MENVVNAPSLITLSAGCAAGDVTIAASAASPISANVRILVGTELMLVTGGTGGTTWNVTRGIEGTTATAHLIGDGITFLLTAGGIDQLLTEISGSGALASRPVSALRTGARYKPTDSPYDYVYDGALWVPYFAGYAMTEPVDANFSWRNQGSAAVSTASGGVILTMPSGQSSDNWRIREMAVPTAPYTITVAFLANIKHADFTGLGIVLRDNGGTPKLVSLALAHDSGVSSTLAVQATKWTSVSAFSAHYANIKWSPFGPLVWLRVTDDNTNRITSYSTDGKDFIQLHSVGRTDFITPTHIGFGINTTNSAAEYMWLLHWLQQ